MVTNKGNENTGKKKRYYWIKLQSGFFNSLVIKKIRKQEHGADMVICYLEMMAATADSKGVIMYQQIGDSIAEEISEEIAEPEELVISTMEFLEKYDLLETGTLTVGATKEEDTFSATEDGQDIRLPQVEMITGDECESASRVRKLRERKKAEALHCNTDVTTNVTLDIEYREKENKSTDYKEKENTHTYTDARADAQVCECENPVDSGNDAECRSDFQKILDIYPKASGSTRAYSLYRDWLNGRNVNGEVVKFTGQQMMEAVQKYVNQQNSGHGSAHWLNIDNLFERLSDYVAFSTPEPQEVDVVSEPDPEPEPEPEPEPQTIDRLKDNGFWIEATTEEKEAFINICDGYLVNTDIHWAFDNFHYIVNRGHWLVDDEPFNFTPEEISGLVRSYKAYHLQKYGTDTYYWDDLPELLTKNSLNGFLNGVLGKTIVDLDEQPKKANEYIPLYLRDDLPF